MQNCHTHTTNYRKNTAHKTQPQYGGKVYYYIHIYLVVCRTAHRTQNTGLQEVWSLWYFGLWLLWSVATISSIKLRLVSKQSNGNLYSALSWYTTSKCSCLRISISLHKKAQINPLYPLCWRENGHRLKLLRTEVTIFHLEFNEQSQLQVWQYHTYS